MQEKFWLETKFDAKQLYSLTCYAYNLHMKSYDFIENFSVTLKSWTLQLNVWQLLEMSLTERKNMRGISK